MAANGYHVSLNDKQEGPFNMNQLGAMIAGGRINADTLVWNEDMPEWTRAAGVSELAALFNQATEREQTKKAALEAKAKDEEAERQRKEDEVKEAATAKGLAKKATKVTGYNLVEYMSKYVLTDDKEELCEIAKLAVANWRSDEKNMGYNGPMPWFVLISKILAKSQTYFTDDPEHLQKIQMITADFTADGKRKKIRSTIKKIVIILVVFGVFVFSFFGYKIFL